MTDDRTAGMSDLLRAEVAARRAAQVARVAPSLLGDTGPLAPLLEAAHRELDAAKAVGDELRADHASRRIDAILDVARGKADDATRQAVEGMHAAAAAGPQMADPAIDMNALIRARVRGESTV